MHLVCCCDRAVKSAKLLRCKGNFPSNESARNGGCCRLTIYRFSPIATRFPLNIWWCARSFSHSSFSVAHSISINPSVFCCLLSFFTTFFHSAWHWYFLLWTLFFLWYQVVRRKTNTLLLCKQATVLCFIIHFISLYNVFSIILFLPIFFLVFCFCFIVFFFGIPTLFGICTLLICCLIVSHVFLVECIVCAT